MQDIPLIHRIIINIIAYIVYVIVFSFGFSFLFPLVLTGMGYPIPHSADSIFIKIQIFIAVFILLVSLVFRKYVYISYPEKTDIIKNATKLTKKTDKKPEDIKIYVEKEMQ